MKGYETAHDRLKWMLRNPITWVTLLGVLAVAALTGGLIVANSGDRKATDRKVESCG